MDVNPDNPIDSVRFRIVGFKTTAESDSGSVVLEQNDVDVDAVSTLCFVQEFLPGTSSVTSSHSVPPSSFEREQGESVTLTTHKPMVMIGDITQSRPRGDRYRLETPVELTTPDAPHTVVGRITSFSYLNGGL
ncbi:hypothetical protein ACIQVT_01690 [Streptomyces sp. NPDC100445]|uniref:hypothetical protein n=1 Tax=Streptomyces sp. NPDC100445 TaxID=3366102 RepID=UPI00381FF70C